MSALLADLLLWWAATTLVTAVLLGVVVAAQGALHHLRARPSAGHHRTGQHRSAALL